MSDETPETPPLPPESVAPPPAPPAPSVETAAQQAVDRAEAAATRRRWVTLAELVGVAGLIIAALGLWMTWSDRRADDQEKQVEKASEAKVRTLVMLKASAESGGERLKLTDAAHDIQDIDVTFPSALGVAAQTSLLEPRIDAGWVSAPLLTLTDNGPDSQQGRIPVLITASYWDADKERRDTAIYDMVWKTEGRVLRGRALRLEGLLLRERTSSKARLDAIWAREKPKSAK
ncbi:hypothetical protein G4G27_08055 [Sphingomonas sp. So64.6b]|uniref:hypothetical protein n=1 Tax=Sphingomonas sp. So64.6b TaxID=2997354 RepID=UPI0016001121|nr:hypothetical protein [Sphingomonas sp. So64.6b]QNA83945.1 hypothetical protein G4G27_08055 [Sphingomonas sp. So64.6b]